MGEESTPLKHAKRGSERRFSFTSQLQYYSNLIKRLKGMLGRDKDRIMPLYGNISQRRSTCAATTENSADSCVPIPFGRPPVFEEPKRT